MEELIAELERSNDALKEANDDLKKDIQKIRDDYQVGRDPVGRFINSDWFVNNIVLEIFFF